MELGEILRKIIGYKEFYQHLGKVTKVDETKRTCTVELKNGSADLLDVKLQAMQSQTDGVCFFPEKGSDVTVAYFDDDEAFVIQTSKVSKTEIITSGEILLNGDSFGGLIKIEELKTQVNKNSQILSQIQAIFNAWVPVTSDGGAVLKTASTAFTSLQTADLSNIENKNVKHG